MTEVQSAEEAPPSAASFDYLYKQLAPSRVYRKILTEALGDVYGGQLSIAAPADVRMLAARAGLEAGQRVADFCCGLGGPTLLLAAEYGCQMVAVDWSRQALMSCRGSAAAAGLGEWLALVVADIRCPPFADNSFDAIVGIDGFYFGVDLPALYMEMARVLRPGGRVAFYFDVPSQVVVDASPPERRGHRESHRIDHLAALATAGFIHARAEDRTAAQELLLSRMLEVIGQHFSYLRAEIGATLAVDLRDEIRQTLEMTRAGHWPRFLFSARKPDTTPARRR
jgi:ubiquinone/menaquinone biosynthesis C-methylase UbiE